MKFTKMHGLGNDYVYINCLKETIKDRSALARFVSNRNFGVGSDGLICIDKSDVADFKMDMYNADGSSSAMCGNGIRCVGKFVYDKGLTNKTTITVESGGEIKTLELFLKNNVVTSVRVDMGKPILESRLIPIASDLENYIDQPIVVKGKEYRVTCVSMGNPHAVIFMDEIAGLDLEDIGPLFERNPLFPERVNTEFVRVIDANTLEMRVWERGSGETLACGTGACAVLVAAVLNGHCDAHTVVTLRGGYLDIFWDREESGHVFMTGPAVTVFEGEFTINLEEERL